MSNSVFQRVYNWIRQLTTPEWLKSMLEFVVEKILIPTAKQLGESGYNALTELIIQASKHSDWSNEHKFEFVYSEFCKGWANGVAIKERTINYAIETVYNELKEKGIVK